jgi:hypothetical protein
MESEIERVGRSVREYLSSRLSEHRVAVAACILDVLTHNLRRQ